MTSYVDISNFLKGDQGDVKIVEGGSTTYVLYLKDKAKATVWAQRAEEIKRIWQEASKTAQGTAQQRMEAGVLAVIRTDIGVEYYRGSGANKDTPQLVR